MPTEEMSVYSAAGQAPSMVKEVLKVMECIREISVHRRMSFCILLHFTWIILVNVKVQKDISVTTGGFKNVIKAENMTKLVCYKCIPTCKV